MVGGGWNDIVSSQLGFLYLCVFDFYEYSQLDVDVVG